MNIPSPLPHAFSILLLCICTNWSWSQTSLLMTGGDKRQEENSKLSGLLRKLGISGIVHQQGQENAVSAKTMLQLNFREIESVSTGSDKHTDTGDKTANGAKQRELALSAVQFLSPEHNHSDGGSAPVNQHKGIMLMYSYKSIGRHWITAAFIFCAKVNWFTCLRMWIWLSIFQSLNLPEEAWENVLEKVFLWARLNSSRVRA